MKAEQLLNQVVEALRQHPPIGVSANYVNHFVRRNRPAMLAVLERLLVPNSTNPVQYPRFTMGIRVPVWKVVRWLAAPKEEDAKEPETVQPRSVAGALQDWFRTYGVQASITPRGGLEIEVHRKEEATVVEILLGHRPMCLNGRYRLVAQETLDNFPTRRPYRSDLTLPIEAAPIFGTFLLARTRQKWSTEEIETAIHGSFLLEAMENHTEFLPEILALPFAQRLLWRQAGRVFRVAEDGTVADENDEMVELGRGVVRAVKAEELGEEARRMWGRIFWDYEVGWVGA